MERVICDLYCRVSTTEQAEEGYSIGEQETRLRMYAEAQGWIVHDVLIDGGFSGSNLNRPAVKKLIANAQNRKINKVLVYRLDRISRNQRDTMYMIEEVFLKNGVDFVSMTESFDTSTPFGLATTGFLSVFAQLERETIKEKTMLGRDSSIKKGNYRGGGFDVTGYRYDARNRQLCVDEYEAKVIRDMFTMFAGGATAGSIAKKLNIEYKFRACTWTSHKVVKILRQPLYIGYQRWKGEVLKVNNCPIIVPPELWDAVQIELNRKTSKAPKAQSPHNHTTMLGGLIWCGRCGCRYAGCSDHDSRGNLVYRYYCYKRLRKNHHTSLEGCDNSSWRAEKLDGIVLEELSKIAVSFGEEGYTGKPRSIAFSDDLSAINKRLEELQQQESRLIDLYSIGKIDSSLISSKLDTLAEERTSLLKQMEEIKKPSDVLNDKELRAAVTTFKDIIAASDNHMDLYHVVHQLVRSVTVNGDDVQIVWNFNL